MTTTTPSSTIDRKESLAMLLAERAGQKWVSDSAMGLAGELREKRIPLAVHKSELSAVGMEPICWVA